MELIVRDRIGRIVLREQISGSVWNASDLTEGSYFIELIGRNGGRYRSRFERH